jgi:adenine/guanine phosphoribosyltransferase-like PRPP-binding protein
MRRKKYDLICKQLYVVDLLRLIKNEYSFNFIAKQTKISASTLNRYASGDIMPNPIRAEKLMSKLLEIFPLDKLLKNKLVTHDGYIDNSKILSDTVLLRHISRFVIETYSGKRINKVATIAADGIPLAVQVARELSVPIIYAKKNREVGIKKFIEEVVKINEAAIEFELYIPKELLKKGDDILIVDDIIRDGAQQYALFKIIKKARAEVVGIFTLVAIGDRWRDIRDLGDKVKYLLHFREEEL